MLIIIVQLPIQIKTALDFLMENVREYLQKIMMKAEMDLVTTLFLFIRHSIKDFHRYPYKKKMQFLTEELH